MADNSLINTKGIGAFAKPMQTLIDKVAEAAGVIYEPTRIRRKAKAEADAAEIEVRGQLKVEQLLAQANIKDPELGKRAVIRMVQEETKAQQNIEDVVEGAAQYLREDAEPDKMGDDWVRRFFGKCRTASDKQMQDLWSRVLASEANCQGAFSPRTIEFIGEASRKEAEAFTRLCRHVWIVNKEPIPLVFDHTAHVYTSNDIDFDLLSNLRAIGLIHFNDLTGYQIRRLPGAIRVSYCSRAFNIRRPKTKNGMLPVGHVFLTPTGKELLRVVVHAPYIDGTIEYALKHWRDNEYPVAPSPKDPQCPPTLPTAIERGATSIPA